MKTLIIIFFLPLFISAQSKETIDNQLRWEIQTLGARVGLSAKNIATGEDIVIDGDSLFPTASIIKLPVLVEMQFQCSEGKLSPTTKITLVDSLKKPGSGVLQYFQMKEELSLIDVATLMIITSDNTATNHVIDQLGNEHDEKLDAVNRRMEMLGLHHTKLQNKLYSLATKKKTWEAKRYGIGYSTPNDMMVLLERIVKGEIVNRSVSESIITMMRGQQFNEMAPRYLPFTDDSTLWVANKTGSLDEVKNDIGIVSSSKGTYVYSIFLDNSPDQGEQLDNKATLLVAKLSKMLFDYYFKR